MEGEDEDEKIQEGSHRSSASFGNCPDAKFVVRRISSLGELTG